jgi:hypothetical protein
MNGPCWIGKRRELLDGEFVIGVRAGLGRITAYPSVASSLRSSSILSVIVGSLTPPRVWPSDDDTKVGEVG